MTHLTQVLKKEPDRRSPYSVTSRYLATGGWEIVVSHGRESRNVIFGRLIQICYLHEIEPKACP